MPIRGRNWQNFTSFVPPKKQYLCFHPLRKQSPHTSKTPLLRASTQTVTPLHTHGSLAESTACFCLTLPDPCDHNKRKSCGGGWAIFTSKSHHCLTIPITHHRPESILAASLPQYSTLLRNVLADPRCLLDPRIVIRLSALQVPLRPCGPMLESKARSQST